ncbi:MAG: flagellar basal body rod protein FlgC [Candidatus Wallbacteria bacterium HGW-Wallbacteria-1]|jgi:flagellar basal-body rod protein FlgC|uniref:Flagellar basal-body rod protein FlgC n=1 Tax=Candidatus Wallbacteria bacterium HGW-Wallbacteria-1 TaxID=2013854 RepID=A0A2N1PSR6_9BACT|nr:MAG: flagellar basal body rod protein FlgC [Candidatus Wallbacteria bacterium HGW-Wallbacteria-1]
MGLFSTLDISASGLTAERLRMDIISNNIANVNTTSPDGKAYRRQMPVFQVRDRITPVPDVAQPMSSRVGMGVRCVAVMEDSAPLQYKYDPSHPHANKEGYVALPNVNIVKEMVDMITATRAYEANAQVITNTRNMITQALNISTTR